MKPEAEKRLAYALAGGAIIPITCLLITLYLPGMLGWYARLPISLPSLVYDYFYPDPPGLDPMFVGLSHLEPGYWVFLIIGNITLYSLLIYSGLCWKQRMPRLK
jgi:hypothetical protein